LISTHIYVYILAARVLHLIRAGKNFTSQLFQATQHVATNAVTVLHMVDSWKEGGIKSKSGQKQNLCYN